MKKTMFFLMIWLISMASACRKEKIDSNPIPIQFELRLINEQGLVSTKFAEGENFKLSFIMRNPTDSIWAFKNSLNVSNDFFRIYDTNDKTFGKPFVLAFCSQEPLGTLGIDGKSAFEIVIPWVVKDSSNYPFFCQPIKLPYLKKGNYKTGFKSTFQFLLNGGKILKTDTLNFNVNFSII